MAYETNSMEVDELATQLAEATLEHQHTQDIGSSNDLGEDEFLEELDLELDCSEKSRHLGKCELPPSINDNSTVEDVATFLLEFAYDEIKFTLPFQNDPEKLFALCTLLSDEIMVRCAAESMGLPLFAPPTHPFYPYWLPDHPVNELHLRYAMSAVEEVEMRMAAKGGFENYLN